MKCVMCGGEAVVTEQDATVELPLEIHRVTVSGVPIYTCQTCGETYEELPPVETLLREVTEIVCRLDELTGAEIRFLRRRVGWSGKDFAKAFCVRPETVSRWENDERRMGYFEQKMLRIFARHGALLDDYGPDIKPEKYPEGQPHVVFVPDFVKPTPKKGARSGRAAPRKRSAVGG